MPRLWRLEWEDALVAVPDSRSDARAVMVPFRMSTARRAELKARAEREGLTVQELLERDVWGDHDSLPAQDQMALPLTG